MSFRDGKMKGCVVGEEGTGMDVVSDEVGIPIARIYTRFQKVDRWQGGIPVTRIHV